MERCWIDFKTIINVSKIKNIDPLQKCYKTKAPLILTGLFK